MGIVTSPADPHYQALARTDWRYLPTNLTNSPSYQSAYIPTYLSKELSTYRPISRGIYEPTNLPIGLSLSRLRLSALGIYQPINLTARHSIDSESTYLTIDLLPYDL